MDKDIRHIAKTISALSSTELNELTYVLMEKHDMSATIYRFGVIPDVETSVDENEECDIWLEKTGMRKLTVMKFIKDTFDVGLRDAKYIVDNAPCYLKEFILVDEAQKIAEELTEIGATVKLKYHD